MTSIIIKTAESLRHALKPWPVSATTRLRCWHVAALCRDLGIECREKPFSLTDVYSADEAFTTGTLSGLRPVGEIDARKIGSGARGAVTERLQQAYAELLRRES
jgi:branched-subunit amino acid aminotransferase/4-amino-4-deoxychorismate lyase